MYGAPILSVDLEGHGREEIIEDVDLSRTVDGLQVFTQFI